MTKQDAIAAVGPVAEHHEGVTNFFVTTDGAVHTNAELAVAKAVELSPGNPTVIDVSINELNQKPEEQKPEEQKPEEQKPEEQKPEEQKPEEQKPNAKKAGEQRAEDKK